MREILFRGKRVDNGDWIVGFLEFHLVDGDLTKTKQDAFITYDYMDKIGKVYRDRFDVIPETAGQFTGVKDKNNNLVEGYVIIATILPEQLSLAVTPREERKAIGYMKENVEDTLRLGYQLGADGIGLGALSGTFTKMGKATEEKYPEIGITTGHSFTSQLIRDTFIAATDRLAMNDLGSLEVAVVGAGGSIGESAARFCAGRVGRMTLFDLGAKENIMQQFIEINKKSSNTEINCVTVVNGKDPKYELLKNADVVICASTATEPFIRSDWLKKGALVIDDSAPFNIGQGVVESVGGVTLHVVARTPDGVGFNFPFGLATEDSIFACGVEITALAMAGKLKEGHTGPSNEDSIQRIAPIVTAAGFGLAPFQSFGVLVTDQDFEIAKKVRQGRLTP